MQTTTIGIADSQRNLYSIVQQEVDLGAQVLRGGRADMAIALFQSAHNKLQPGQPFYDYLAHNLLSSYSLMIEQLVASGDNVGARSYLTLALRLEIRGNMAGDKAFVHKFAGAYQAMGLVFFKQRLIEESLLCFRRSLSIYRAPGFHINLSNALAAGGMPARIEDFTNEIETRELGRHIFIACAPKSGSTFLKDLLVSVTGYRDAFMVYAAGQNEHELYLPTVLELARVDTVTQQHCRASDANVHIMQGFGIRPVVLVRDIFDSVMSLLDFYDKGAFMDSYFRADYQSLDRRARVDLIIDNVIPWYFQFIASWAEVEKRGRVDILWLNFEELIADKSKSVQEVLAFYGLGASIENIDKKVKATESEKKKIRFNKGVAGRGESGLSNRQKNKIRGLAKYYPSTDLSRLGI